MNTKREKIIEDFIEVFIRMKKSMGGNRDVFFREFELNKAQVDLLYYLYHSKDLRVNVLATKLGVTDGAITQLVNGLIKLKYLQKIQDSTDRRVVRIEFTEFGNKRFEEFRKCHIEKLKKKLENLSDEELITLKTLLEKIIK